METDKGKEINVTYNLSGLDGLEADNKSFFDEMIGLFIKSTSEGIEEMKEAMAKEDWEQVAEKAHKVLGPCRHLEVMPLMQTLKSIEHNIFEEKKTENVPGLIAKAEAEAAETIDTFKKLLAR